MSIKSISLPDIPEGKSLEDFVSAFYQVSGVFVERSIIQREEEEVLELDILTTDYNVTPPSTLLTEVKSGGWGLSDLFKLSGWLHYLHLPSAVFVATKGKDHLDFHRGKASDMGIQLVVIPDLKDAAGPLAPITHVPHPDLLDVSIWRFSSWMDRVLAADLTHKKKSSPAAKRFHALAQYLYAVNSSTFFRQTISERMYLLASTYKEHPNISAKASAEMKGESFDADHDAVDAEHFKATFYNCEYNDLQISTYVEHRARLALMKHATDYLLYSKAGKADIAKDGRRIKILEHEFELSPFEELPHSFREGIEAIKDEPFFHRYPVFWQWFMWAYGGFILLDKEADEYSHMSARTGIPTEEIPHALKAYDRLFPTGGWFIDTSPNALIRKLKMFPVPFMGLGAHYRRRIYCHDKDFSTMPVTGRHTTNDLISWNNAAVELFSK
jgi:hypothetical protein